MKKHTGFLIVSIIALTFMLSISAQPPPEDTQPVAKYFGNLTLLIDSDACHCIQERNREISKTLSGLIENALIDTNFIKYQKYDYAKQPDIVDSLLKISHEKFLPILYLRSYDNFLFYECSLKMDSTQFIEGLQELMNIYRKEVKH